MKNWCNNNDVQFLSFDYDINSIMLKVDSLFDEVKQYNHDILLGASLG